MAELTAAQREVARKLGRRIEALDDRIKAALQTDPNADVTELEGQKAELEAQIENAEDDEQLKLGIDRDDER